MTYASRGSSPVVVVDYGLGNLHSVARGLRAAGADVRVTSDPAEIASAERLVLPGVGAFGDGMTNLTRRGLVGPVQEFVATGRPLLGICLGMQLLMSESEEFGLHRGLDLVPGRVVAFPAPRPGVSGYKVPHVGWNVLLPSAGRSWEGTLLSRVSAGEHAYFVHSFVVVPADPSYELACTLYAGQMVCASIQKDNIQGCQFHPEKSGEVGWRILRQFVRG